MPEPATAAAAKRSVRDIQAELDKAMRRYHELHPKVEADQRKAALRAQEIEQRIKQWQALHPGAPFDADDAGVDITPYRHDDALHREFYNQHHTIARLQNELAAAIADSTKAL